MMIFHLVMIFHFIFWEYLYLVGVLEHEFYDFPYILGMSSSMNLFGWDNFPFIFWDNLSGC